MDSQKEPLIPLGAVLPMFSEAFYEGSVTVEATVRRYWLPCNTRHMVALELGTFNHHVYTTIVHISIYTCICVL